MATETSAIAEVTNPEEGEPRGAGTAKPGSRFMVLLAVMTLLPAAGGAWLAYLQYGHVASALAAINFVDFSEESDDQSIQFGQFMEIQNLVINPAGTEGQRYLMLSLGIESLDPAVLEEVSQKEIVVRDTVLKLLGERTVTELSSIDARATLKDQLRDAVNSILSTGVVDRLYFTQYVMQ